MDEDFYVFHGNNIILTNGTKDLPVSKALHESIHFWQRHNNPWYYVRYALCPFPVFWTKRAEWEWEAYIAETLFHFYIAIERGSHPTEAWGNAKHNILLKMIENNFFNIRYFFMDINRFDTFANVEIEEHAALPIRQCVVPKSRSYEEWKPVLLYIQEMASYVTKN